MLASAVALRWFPLSVSVKFKVYLMSDLLKQVKADAVKSNSCSLWCLIPGKTWGQPGETAGRVTNHHRDQQDRLSGADN